MELHVLCRECYTQKRCHEIPCACIDKISIDPWIEGCKGAATIDVVISLTSRCLFIYLSISHPNLPKPNPKTSHHQTSNPIQNPPTLPNAHIYPVYTHHPTCTKPSPSHNPIRASMPSIPLTHPITSHTYHVDPSTSSNRSSSSHLTSPHLIPTPILTLTPMPTHELAAFREPTRRHGRCDYDCGCGYSALVPVLTLTLLFCSAYVGWRRDASVRMGWAHGACGAWIV